MQTQVFSGNFAPRKTNLGAHIVALRDDSLPSALRRLLLLADGVRDVNRLAAMIPGRDIHAELSELERRGLIYEDGAAPQTAAAANKDLPDEWMSATSFMMERARESLGVAAVNVIDELQQAQDPDQARQAMTSWYRAMRESRQERSAVDADRLKVTSMLSAGASNRPRV